ncbi:hypothetical protein RB614_33150 [Phytohabitans sp. ZYX-F-186]|uniref:ADP ribosyltransferase domain-containing protein n=1 Tax=Phytohabitans maris TaxID=3071409 RepID=A0ABU0ZRK3_9ACTN|nr:hypothetical protein [Phytohabitans sp. ZYX-F-186]MDQ7909381.1 hypothetical protein [Phytohabitans sp. ZYX-F-186]
MGRMSLRRLRDWRTPAPSACGDGLIVEHYGVGVLITHPADPPYVYWRMLRTAAGTAGEPLVLMSPGAAGHPEARTVLADAVCAAARARPGRERVWLGNPGLGGTDPANVAWLAALSRTSGVDLVAADGQIAFLPGGGLYAGPTSGASGWRLFGPDGAGDIIGYRYPAPGPPPQTPARPARADGRPGERVPSALTAGWLRRDTRLWWLGDEGDVVAEVVPAGILLRPGGLYTSDALVVVDPLSSTISVGTVGFPVPATLVDALRRLVAGAPPDPPGALLLRVTGEADPERRAEIAAVAEEAGWETEGVPPGVASSPRASAPPPRVSAPPLPAAPLPPLAPTSAPPAPAPDPLPPVPPQLSWVSVLPLSEPAPLPQAPISPAPSWLSQPPPPSSSVFEPPPSVFGPPPSVSAWPPLSEEDAHPPLSAPIEPPLPKAAEPLPLEQPEAPLLEHTEPLPAAGPPPAPAQPVGVEPVPADLGSPPAPAQPADVEPVPADLGPPPAPAQPVDAGPLPAPAPPADVGPLPAPARPVGAWPPLAVSAPPTRVVSNPVPVPPPAAPDPVPGNAPHPPPWAPDPLPPTAPAPVPDGAPDPVTAGVPDLAQASATAAVPAQAAAGASGPGATAYPMVVAAPVITVAEPSTDEPPPAPEAPAVTVTAPVAPAVPVRLADRASTAAEQRAFVAALGPAFTDSLATVNAALSTWPALRDDSPGAKADYAAVCVYLGGGGWGAVRLNAALRAGRPPELDGYLACLVSGMRRLPLHRRAVLCQATVAGPVELSYPVGEVLTEPAFRSASAGLDVAVPGANVDLLILSRTARQISVLAPRDRVLEEAAFLGGTRFKVLEVRRSEAKGGDGAALPGTAVLLREVPPGERAAANGPDDADRLALDRLARALAHRQSQPPRAVEDADLMQRLAGPALGAAGAAVAYP